MELNEGFYRVTIGSYENDGDNESEMHIDTPDRATVKFIVEFAKMFESKNMGPNKFGNLHQLQTEFFVELINMTDVAYKFISEFESIAQQISTVNHADKHGTVMDLLEIIHGYSDVFYTRATDYIKVDFIPDSTVDVTRDFL